MQLYIFITLCAVYEVCIDKCSYNFLSALRKLQEKYKCMFFVAFGNDLSKVIHIQSFKSHWRKIDKVKENGK
jgi:hypothetical protein